MRHELTDLIGQQVVCIGHYASQKTTETGVRHLIKKPKIYGYNPFRRVRKDQPLASTDHLWLDNQPELPDAGDRLYTPHVMAGVISTYVRKDGTTDIGITPKPSINLDMLLNFLRKEESQYLPRDYEIGLIEKLLTYLEEAQGSKRLMVTVESRMTAKDLFFEVKRGLLRLKNSYYTTHTIASY